jgi:hypothetical protein
MICRILQIRILSRYRYFCGHIGCFHICCCSFPLHITNRIVRFEVDLVNTILVNEDTVEVEFDRETYVVSAIPQVSEETYASRTR